MVNSKRTHDRPAKRGAATTMMSLMGMGVLLVLPGMALQPRDVDFRSVGAYAVVLNVLTYWTYARDKRRAESGEWRVSEARLHLLEVLGGWPAAFLAQRTLRHKCSKGSYQFVFWLIVLAWQFAAVDSLQNWKFSKAAQGFLERTSEHRK
jgi:uncharacterized membrane protein YsdA (DUF1294 family)